MEIDKSAAREAVQALLDASGQLARVAELVPPNRNDEGVMSYRREIARIIMAIFDELSFPLYQMHPDLIPDREREIVADAIRRLQREKK